MHQVEKFIDFVGEVTRIWILISLLTIAILTALAFLIVRLVKTKTVLIVFLFVSLLSGVLVGKFESSFFLGMIVSAPTFVIFTLALVIKFIRDKHAKSKVES